MSAEAPEGLIVCPILGTVADRPTDYWNGSCALDELDYAVARGATGATSNPSIVLEVLRKERAHLAPWITELAVANPLPAGACFASVGYRPTPVGKPARQALAAAASRAFCQSALNWTIPLSVSG